MAKNCHYTDAITLIAGEDFRKKCRRPEIMADAAYAIITQDSRACTGNFFIDEKLLRQQGVTDFDQYSVVPGTKDLMLDFFVEENISELQRQQSPMGREKTETSSSSEGGPNVEPIFEKIKKSLTPDLLKTINSVYLFDLQGDKWYLDMKNDNGSVGQGEPPSGKAQCTFKMSKSDFQEMFAGKLKPNVAFMGGKLKIQGDLPTALKLEKLLNQMVKSKL